MTNLLLSWGYIALFIATVLAAAGIPTGSELVIAFAGALASGRLPASADHHLNVYAVIVIATAGELIGAFVGYGIGRIGGRPLVERVGHYILVTTADVDRAEQLFDRHGDPVVFFGRFIPLLRSFVGLAAGLAEMSVAKFALFTAFAAAVWCTGFAALGDALGASWASAVHRVTDIGYVVAAVFILGVIVMFVTRIRAVCAERAAESAPNRTPLDARTVEDK